jgi:hypothetical protein
MDNKEVRVRLLAVIILCAIALPAASAQAWTWPVDGPVLRPFLFDSAHPYAGGQHRGIDIGGDEGAAVRAPIDGVVSFAGTVPTGGKTVSIETPLGYTATLLHLGTIAVTRGSSVAEGATLVGTVGAADGAQPYVYFGVRVTSEPQGYVDPLTLLPPPPSAEPAQAPEASSAPVVAPASSSEPAAPIPQQPAEPAPSVSVEPPAPPSAQPAAPAEMAAPAEPAPPVAVESSPAQPAPDASPGPAEVPVVPVTALVPLAAPAAEQAPVGSASETVDSGSRARIITAAEPPRPLAAVGLLPLEAPATTGLPRETLLDPSAVPVLVRSARAGSGRGVERSGARGKRGHVSPVRGTTSVIASSRYVGSGRQAVLRDGAIGVLCGAICGVLVLLVRRRRRAVRAKPARIMSVPVGCTVEEDSRRARVAVRERFASPRARGGLRGPGRHLRALPPAEGQRRPDGERDGRARDAGDGLRRQGRRLAA